MPEFKNLPSAAGLTELNNYLATRSFVDGYKPTQADVKVATQLSINVDSESYPHVSRWLSHILSFSIEQRSAWTGTKSSAAPLEEKSSKKAAAADDSDDDFMTSLSDDDEDDDAAAAIIAKKKSRGRNGTKEKRWTRRKIIDCFGCQTRKFGNGYE